MVGHVWCPSINYITERYVVGDDGVTTLRL